jgi:hypothetical protein
MAVQSIVACAALAILGLPAFAQASSSLSRPAPVATAAASTSAPARWTCASRATIEIAPVSFDTWGSAEAWVMVHRVKGEVIAAERIDRREVEKLRTTPCSEQGGVALVG